MATTSKPPANLARTFNPAMLTLARESRGLTQSALAKKIAISQGHISKLEAGLLPASDSVVAALSAELNYPEHFFFLDEPVYGPGVSEFFHRKNQMSTKVLSRIHADLNIRRMHVSRLMAAAELHTENIQRLDPDDFGGSPEAVARAVRASWQLPRGPIENLTTAIEDAGGIVIHCDFGTRDVAGISRWVPGLPPMFFLNRDMPGDRDRMTLAHELGHMVMHHAPTAEMEDEAFAFARELLMPEEDIRPFLHDISIQSLAAMKPYWKVSIAGLLYCAGSLGVVTERQKRYLYMRMGELGFRRQEPPELDIPKERPSLLQEVLDLHRNDLGYSLEDLANMLAMNPDEVRALYNVEQSPEDRRGRMRVVS